MSVTITWKIENRLIYVNFEGDVSIDEIAHASQTVTQYIWQGQPPVHVIAEILHVDRYPRDFRQLSDAIPHHAEPNLGKTVLIGTNDRLMNLMVSVIRHVVQIDLRMVGSLEEALAFLHEADPTLPGDTSS